MKVATKTIPPPANQEPSNAGPMRTRKAGRGGGRAPPSPLKTLAGGSPDQPRSPQSGQALDQLVLGAHAQGPPLHQGAKTPEEERRDQHTSVSEWKFIIASAFKFKLLRQPEAAGCALTIMVRATASWAETSGAYYQVYSGYCSF